MFLKLFLWVNPNNYNRKVIFSEVILSNELNRIHISEPSPVKFTGFFCIVLTILRLRIKILPFIIKRSSLLEERQETLL